LNGKLAELEADVEQRISDEIGQDTGPEKISAAGETQAIDGVTSALAFQVKA
jgi:hypothetical protein